MEKVKYLIPVYGLGRLFSALGSGVLGSSEALLIVVWQFCSTMFILLVGTILLLDKI